MAAGHVYILINANMPGLLKIGMTERTPEERARELSAGTGVSSPFIVHCIERVHQEVVAGLRLDGDEPAPVVVLHRGPQPLGVNPLRPVDDGSRVG